MYSLLSILIIPNQVRPLPQTLNDEFVALSPTVDVPDIVCCGLKVAGGVVALGDENIVIDAALKRLVQWNRGALQNQLLI